MAHANDVNERGGARINSGAGSSFQCVRMTTRLVFLGNKVLAPPYFVDVVRVEVAVCLTVGPSIFGTRNLALLVTRFACLARATVRVYQSLPAEPVEPGH